MTYEELVERVRETYVGLDASFAGGHAAFQFNIRGEAEGAFYMEIVDGEVCVEPYEYFDRDVLFTTTAESLLKIGDGRLDLIWAYSSGKMRIDGSMEKALILKRLAELAQEPRSEKPKEEEKDAETDIESKNGELNELPANEETGEEQVGTGQGSESDELPANAETGEKQVGTGQDGKTNEPLDIEALEVPIVAAETLGNNEESAIESWKPASDTTEDIAQKENRTDMVYDIDSGMAHSTTLGEINPKDDASGDVASENEPSEPSHHKFSHALRGKGGASGRRSQSGKAAASDRHTSKWTSSKGRRK